jgi:hypothetical protein
MTKVKKVSITEDQISQFICSISNKYEIGEDDLIKQWETQFKINKKSPVKKPSVEKLEYIDHTKPVPEEILNSSTLVELKEFCRNRGVKVSGTKANLIARLKGEEETKTVVKKSVKITNDKKAKKIEESSVVLEQLKSRAPSFELRRNNYGNIVHPDFNLVFNKINGENTVIGTENESGKVEQLTKEDIQLCKKYKFQFIGIPEILNNTDEEVIEEEIIDDEEEEEEIIEEEIMEESD